MATAVIGVGHNDTDVASTTCRMNISDGTGPTNGLTAMTNAGGTFVIDENGTSTVSSHSSQTLSLTGASVKPPGTYNVQVGCGASDLTAGKDWQLHYGNVNVWAVGT